MASTIYEYHGARPGTAESRANAAVHRCPFIKGKCKKKHGACSLKLVNSEPVIICPNRLYGDAFKIIADVGRKALNRDGGLVDIQTALSLHRAGAWDVTKIIAFGQGYGKELSVSAPTEETGTPTRFKVDYVLCSADEKMELAEFAAIEVQTIDTTDSYASASKYYRSLNGSGELEEAAQVTKAGLNWENVNKRILPQIIYKGHALRREVKAREGLFFVLPDQVYRKILTRIGNDLLEYPRGPGTVTFETYRLGAESQDGTSPLEHVETFTTSVEQIAFAFVSPRNLPAMGVYQDRITRELRKKSRGSPALAAKS